MNVVVNFLSTLVSDESNGSIKRMLGLCGEFERIAKVVLDKAEKESHARKKRKNASEATSSTQTERNQAQPDPSSSAQPPQEPSTSAPFTPSMFTNAPNAPTSSSPGFGAEPTMPPNAGISNDLPSNINAMSGLGQEFSDWLSPDNMANAGFPDQSSFPTSPNMSSFQQPFVPQDLWQMPMTIEWDWADMSTNFPVFEAGSNGQPPQ